MKIHSFKRFLLEERHSQVYAYHGTKGTYLRSIIKHGLVPNFKNGGYGSDEISVAGVPMTPHPAVYFNLDRGDAEFIAQETGSDGLVVIAKMSMKSTSVDEDNLIRTVEMNITRRVRTNEDTDNIVNKMLGSGMFLSISDAGERVIIPLLKDYVNVQKEYYKNYSEDDEGRVDPSLLAKLKSIELELTKRLKSLNYRWGKYQKTFKYDGTIGFSGRNKIVGLYLLNDDRPIGWGDLGRLSGGEYNNYPTPSALYNAVKDKTTQDS